jgi:hypothetical protein
MGNLFTRERKSSRKELTVEQIEGKGNTKDMQS